MKLQDLIENLDNDKKKAYELLCQDAQSGEKSREEIKVLKEKFDPFLKELLQDLGQDTLPKTIGPLFGKFKSSYITAKKENKQKTDQKKKPKNVMADHRRMQLEASAYLALELAKQGKTDEAKKWSELAFEGIKFLDSEKKPQVKFICALVMKKLNINDVSEKLKEEAKLELLALSESIKNPTMIKINKGEKLLSGEFQIPSMEKMQENFLKNNPLNIEIVNESV